MGLCLTYSLTTAIRTHWHGLRISPISKTENDRHRLHRAREPVRKPYTLVPLTLSPHSFSGPPGVFCRISQSLISCCISLVK